MVLVTHPLSTKIYSIAEPHFTKVGSSMLYFEKTPSSYHEAIQTCANYGAELVELHNKEEWSEVKNHKIIFNFTVINILLRAHFSNDKLHETHICGQWLPGDGFHATPER